MYSATYTLSLFVHFCLCVYICEAVVLLGEAASGKSAALSTAASTLNAEQANPMAIKLSKVYPNAVHNLCELFGSVDPTTGNWEDGVFSSIFRKAHQVE